MIPKTIHYCWFGGNPLPKDAQKCIASWRKYMPDYEIIQWDESNFDVNSIPYTAQAYEAKKYAFVSDYARFKILYENGGVYFDTDVEVIKPMDTLIAKGSFMGLEYSDDKTPCWVNPGLGMACEKGNPFIKSMLLLYSNYKKFELGTHTVVTNTTYELKKHGLMNENILQIVAGFNIYPASYFCPMNSKTGIIKISSETYSIHHYSCSWIDHSTVRWKMHILKNYINRILGEKFLKFINCH